MANRQILPALLSLPLTAGATELSIIDVEIDGMGGVDGLAGGQDVVISPDGRHVMVAASFDWAVSIFERDGISGTLEFVDSIHEFESDGLSGVSEIDLSPDGLNLYSGSLNENKLGVFARNPESGALTLLEVHEEGVAGVSGLDGPAAVQVSPDGNHVYVGAIFGDSIAIFARGPATGTLTFVEAIFDGVGGVDGLDAVNGITLSPDGQHLYAAATNDDAVAVFERAGDGGLTFVEAKKDGVAGVDGLDMASSVAVSPDGEWLVAASHPDGIGNDDWIAVFSRDSNSGALEFKDALTNPTPGTLGACLGAPSDPDVHVVFAPAGRRVYVSNSPNSAAVAIEFSPEGVASLAGYGCNGEGGVSGLQSASGIAVSQDGRHVYATGFFDHGLVAFEVVDGLEFKSGFETPATP